MTDATPNHHDSPAVIPFKNGNNGKLLVAVEKGHLRQLLERCLDQHETKKQARRQDAI